MSFFWKLCDRANYASYYWDITLVICPCPGREACFSREGVSGACEQEHVSGIF